MGVQGRLMYTLCETLPRRKILAAILSGVKCLCGAEVYLFAVVTAQPDLLL